MSIINFSAKSTGADLSVASEVTIQGEQNASKTVRDAGEAIDERQGIGNFENSLETSSSDCIPDVVVSQDNSDTGDSMAAYENSLVDGAGDQTDLQHEHINGHEHSFADNHDFVKDPPAVDDCNKSGQFVDSLSSKEEADCHKRENDNFDQVGHL